MVSTLQRIWAQKMLDAEKRGVEHRVFIEAGDLRLAARHIAWMPGAWTLVAKKRDARGRYVVVPVDVAASLTEARRIAAVGEMAS